VALGLAGVAVYCVGKSADGSGALLIPAVLCALIAVGICANLFKRIAILTDNDVTYTCVWGSRDLEKSNIKGFRVGEKAIFIEPLQDGYKKIIIRDYFSLGQSNQLIASLRAKYTDLNKVEFEESKEEILHDNAFGATEDEREAALKTRRQYVRVYSFGGIGLFFFNTIFPDSNVMLLVAELIYPLIGIALLAYGKGLVRLFAKKNSAYPSLFIGLLFSSLVPVIAANLDAKILDFSNAWTPAIVVFAVMCAVLYYFAVKVAQAPLGGQVAFILIVAAGYGFGSVLLANNLFDQSPAQTYTATVTDRYVHNGKSTSYHIVLGEWGQNHGQENISVSSSVYGRVAVGSQVNVKLKKGFFNIPWFYLAE